MAPPGPVKIGHKKDGCQRQPHRFHVSRPPPLPSRWIHSSGSRGGEGAMAPPGPVKIGHKKDGCQSVALALIFLFRCFNIFLPPANKVCGRGVCSQGGAWSPGGSAPKEGGCLVPVGGAWSGGGVPGLGGVPPLWGCLVETPSGTAMLRALRILLECILVKL